MFSLKIHKGAGIFKTPPKTFLNKGILNIKKNYMKGLNSKNKNTIFLLMRWLEYFNICERICHFPRNKKCYPELTKANYRFMPVIA